MYESCKPHHTTSSSPVSVRADAAISQTAESTRNKPAQPALGNTTKYVEKRRRNFELQGVAARLLSKERVRHCLWSLAFDSDGVQILKREDRARFSGLTLCGSVWHCPVCSARISELRRRELNKALEWSRAEAIIDIEETGPTVVPVMMTLTARHKRGDNLAAQLDGMKRAKQKLRQSHSWRQMRKRIEGTITATEVTHGANGWHSHFHELLFIVAEDADDARMAVDQLRSEWLRSLAKVGLSGGRSAFDVQGAGKAGEYISKWGAGEEMTLREAKTGKGRTPFQLLADAKDGDRQAGALFVEYALAFKGRRQLVWSNGFKKRVGIDDVDDDDAAGDAKDEVVDEIIARISPHRWRELRQRRVDRHALLRAAERGGLIEVQILIDECMSRPPPS